MLDGAALLLAEKGLQGTSFSEVLALTGAPRGSIYHHFPNGKDQLVVEALALAGERVRNRLEADRGRPATEIAEHFLQLWRRLLTARQFSTGCSVAAVSVGADSTTLLDAAADVFRGWTDQLASLLSEGGVPAAEAGGLATVLIAGAEGAVILSRAQRDLAPFDAVAEQLLKSVAAAQ